MTEISNCHPSSHSEQSEESPSLSGKDSETSSEILRQSLVLLPQDDTKGVIWKLGFGHCVEQRGCHATLRWTFIRN